MALVASSCKVNVEPPTPELPIGGKLPIDLEGLEYSFPSSDTKEPYVLISNKEEEAWLIAHGIDWDNQINGKVAVDNLMAIEKLEPSQNSYQINLTSKKSNFLRLKYTDLEKISFPENLNIFENLRKYQDISSYEEIDFTQNSNIEEITVSFDKKINVNGLKKLEVLQILPWSMPPTKVLNDDMDFSTNIELKELWYNGVGKMFDFTNNTKLESIKLLSKNVETLDLSQNSNLRLIDVRLSSNLKTIYVSPETLVKINASTEWIDIQNWQKPENAVWKVKV